MTSAGEDLVELDLADLSAGPLEAPTARVLDPSDQVELVDEGASVGQPMPDHADPRSTSTSHDVEGRTLRAVWEGLNPPYSTIVIDPPWPQKGAGALVGKEGFGDATGASKIMPYSTMTVAEIAALDIPGLASASAHLYLWTTNGFLHDAFHLLERWGFKYSTTLVWAKAPMGGGLGGAHGISTEFVLYARRGRPVTRSRGGSTWYQWKRPYDSRGKPLHSAKPDELIDLVEQISTGPYCELFARRQRLGWDSWGHGYESGAT